MLFMHKNVLRLHVSFTRSYTKDEPNFPQKKVSGVDKVVCFKDFSRPNIEIKTSTFQGPKLNSRTFRDD